MNLSLATNGIQALADRASQVPDLSVVVPIYNEVESIPLLLDAIATSLIPSRFTMKLFALTTALVMAPISFSSSRLRLELIYEP